MQNLIEGQLDPKAKVVVLEDLISTGGSSLKAVEALRKNGNEIVGMVASYTYGFPIAGRNQVFYYHNLSLRVELTFDEVLHTVILWFRTTVYERHVQFVSNQSTCLLYTSRCV